VAFVTEGEERLSSIFETVGAERAARIVEAAKRNGLAEEAKHVTERLAVGKP